MTDRGQKQGSRRVPGWITAILLLLLVAGAVLWQRCGLHGCPDVDMLRGYMPDQASSVVDRAGNEVGKLFVTRRVVVSIDSIPEHVINAFIAIEDKRFWDHGGVDWRRVVGATIANVRARGFEQGSSTITMQLARNVFPEQLPATEQTITRKIGEARVARAIEGRYSKREIMALYLNQIYFGNGAYGIEAAAEEYFGKSATELKLSEAALLAGVPRAPSRLNPRADREAALERRELVLRLMVEQGLITEEQRAEASEARLRLRDGRVSAEQVAPYFIEEVRRKLEDELGSAIYTQGYTIHTTLDPRMQRIVEEELSQTLRSIESGRFGAFAGRSHASARGDSTHDRRDGTAYLQGAMIVMDARTGDVLALVGGRDFDDSQFNRATQAKRQPGSAFKPFVYTAAIGAGYPPTHRLLDQPLRYELGNGRTWEPENYDGQYHGIVSMRQALTHSRNVPTVRLANEIGLSHVLDTAERFGLGRLAPHPSVVLGTAEVTPLQLTSAYSAFATLGERATPRFITRVVDRDGRVVWSSRSDTRRVVDTAVAFIATTMLEDVVDRGTGTGVRAAGFTGAAGGKTGTTQDAADVWFIGFTPELVGTVWIGFDRRRRILRGATGGEIAAPVWGDVMRRIGAASAGWAPPDGVEQRMVDQTGTVVIDGCMPEGGAHTEFFLRGTVPGVNCYPPDYFAYTDTFAEPGAERYDAPTDPSDEWWDRLRERVRGRDPYDVDPDYDNRDTGPPRTDPEHDRGDPPPQNSEQSYPLPSPGWQSQDQAADSVGRPRQPARQRREPLGTPIEGSPRPPDDGGD